MTGSKIAIIGGGVSGLAVAYHLITQHGRNDGVEVTIFESKPTLGGNADTVRVKLGEDYAKTNKDNEPPPPEFTRWADLGVNDFNKNSYTNMVKAMNRMEFYDYKCLEDTVCFFTLDGSVLYTFDDFYKKDVVTEDVTTTEDTRRIVDERFCVPQKLADVNKHFMDTAARDVDGCRDQYKYMTVAKYVDKYIDKHAKKKEDRALIKEMAEHILYPRIAAMYFVDERGPKDMPIVAVMEYYMLQEGYGKGEPERMYFDGGSQKWIDRLAGWLSSREDRPEKEDRELPEVKIRKKSAVRVIADQTGAYVYRVGERGLIGHNEPERFDKVVLACHADHALRSLGPKGLTDEIATMLGKVSYTNSIAVCHTFTGVLPPHRDTWRTYNVMIRKGTAMAPYSMTYVINRHQNDYGEGSEYREAGLPQYFVTLNPAVPIPDNFVLETEESAEQRARRAPGYGFPKPSPRQSVEGDQGVFGEGDHTVPGKAICWFRHNVLDFDCLEAQEMLDKDPKIQGGQFGNVYFTGGWTNGAGLHEQCWVQGKKVVDKMFTE